MLDLPIDVVQEGEIDEEESTSQQREQAQRHATRFVRETKADAGRLAADRYTDRVVHTRTRTYGSDLRTDRLDHTHAKVKKQCCTTYYDDNHENRDIIHDTFSRFGFLSFSLLSFRFFALRSFTLSVLRFLRFCGG